MKNFFIIIFILTLIVLTSLVKTSTRNLEAKIFIYEEKVKILSYKKDLILLENNYLSSPERLIELNKLFFKKKLSPLSLKKFILLKNNE